MLGGQDMQDPDAAAARPREGWRCHDTIAPPGSSPHWPAEAVDHVSRSGWLGLSETEWRNALRSSAMAPPDAGFVSRIREIAEAAARKAAAFANIEEAPGAWWQRQSWLPGRMLSYELRPGANRPGPVTLWARLDATVDELQAAMESQSVPAEQYSLEQLSLVLQEIADALLDRDVYPWPEEWDEAAYEAEDPSDAAADSAA